MSNLKNWLEYIKLLESKEGSIENIINYISGDLQLINYATIKLKNEFPVYEMLMLVNNEDFLPGLSFNTKISKLQKIFEVFFGYAKNLLINFSIYRDKFIKISTSQISDHLSKFPNYSCYLSLIGYDFQENYQDWRFTEKVLSDDHKNKLQYITVCCGLGYDYWNDCLKYLSLNIFSDLHTSIEDLVKNENCEYCDFKMDLSKLMCTVCQTNVDKMSYFDKWKRQIITPIVSHKSLVDSHRNPARDDVKFYSVNGNQISQSPKPLFEPEVEKYHSHNENLTIESWTCKCTIVNSSTQLNCIVCYEPKPENSKNDRVSIEKNMFIETEYDSNLYKLDKSIQDAYIENHRDSTEGKENSFIIYNSTENLINPELSQSNKSHLTIKMNDETKNEVNKNFFDKIMTIILFVYSWIKSF